MAPAASQAPVYLVEDDEAMRDSLSILLELSGFDVRGFESAFDFLRAIEPGAADGPSCLVLDLRIPGMDGFELLRRYRDRLEGWPVVMISGHASEADKAEARALGVQDFLDKPFSEGALLEALGRANTLLAS